MFLGQFHHNLDDKDRLTIPARFRELLDGGAYVTLGFDRNLMVLTASAFQAISESITQMSITDPMSRDLRRLIYANTTQVDVDKAGRILIQKFLRDQVAIGSEVVLVGQLDYFEIWSPVAWEAQLTKMQDAETNAQRYQTLNLLTRST
ncbi:MAG: division/cell wall cluster transcriptional repressor MraZ [Anaerolineales bacterium]|nr:division/cell wall cluster transcriptional repressor MraZ [Anaerolineales bacterium]